MFELFVKERKGNSYNIFIRQSYFLFSHSDLELFYFCQEKNILQDILQFH